MGRSQDRYTSENDVNMNTVPASRPAALLLLGPTSSGKTPLGKLLERDGIWGQRCFHFDFGQRMRHIAADEIVVPGLSDDDLAIIKNALATGALLEDHQFHIAAAILLGFIESERITENDFIVLNGLPRHVGQARDIGKAVSVKGVISLACSPEVVHERIESNSGGDRSGRSDDSLPEIARKLELFRKRTIPLLDHYRSEGIRIHEVVIENHTVPLDILVQLEKETV